MAISLDPTTSAERTERLPNTDELTQLLRLLTAERVEALQKREQEKQRTDENRQAELEAVLQAEAIRKAAQDACNHMQDEGRATTPAIGGQVFSDGMVHGFCLRCHKSFKPFPASEEHRTNGVRFIRVPLE